MDKYQNTVAMKALKEKNGNPMHLAVATSAHIMIAAHRPFPNMYMKCKYPKPKHEVTRKLPGAK